MNAFKALEHRRERPRQHHRQLNKPESIINGKPELIKEMEPILILCSEALHLSTMWV